MHDLLAVDQSRHVKNHEEAEGESESANPRLGFAALLRQANGLEVDRATQLSDRVGVVAGLLEAHTSDDPRKGAAQYLLGDEVGDTLGVVLDPVVGQQLVVDPHPSVDLAVEHSAIELAAQTPLCRRPRRSPLD